MKEVMRDHFEECLEDFCKRVIKIAPPGTRARNDILLPLTRFCKVDFQTFRKWATGRASPTGEIRVRLMCYLSLHGYKIIEFENLPAFLKGVFEIIGFNLLSAKEVAGIVGYTKTSSLFDVLFGKQNISKAKKFIMWNLWKVHKDTLEEMFDESVSVCLDISREVSYSETKNVSPIYSSILLSMQGLVVALDSGIFSNLSKKEIDYLRSAEGKSVIQRLSNHLKSIEISYLKED
ncbi:MAG: hypothetical protein JW740_00665 [Candidatus Zambryskibacteria bacterium]|nr:hypothetical protein [Candidatus Zambryskibacteria bacterium]